ncbi:MAG: hypothetical protein JST16_08875 [Bdellovibrionales bacterium]|nr:hypothetical protein [Bdellovibrionales bacterium]
MSPRARNGLVLAIFLAVGALPWLVLKILPAHPSRNSPPSSTATPEKTLPPDNSLPAAPSSPPPTAQPVMAPPPIRELTSVRDRYLESVPAFPRERLSVHIAPSSGNVYLMELEIDGFKVESTDVRISKNRRGEWYYLPQPWPTLPPNLMPFPLHRESAAEQKIHDQLRTEQNSEDTLESLGASWVPAPDGLRPCLKWRVDYRTTTGEQKKEQWCINAQTLNLDARSERTRN